MTPLTKPPALRPGQTVAVVATSSALPDAKLLPEAVRAMEALGYPVRVDACCTARHGYLAGDDDARADALMRAFTDGAVGLILCMRGGYGAMRILGRLDYRVIAKHPKLFSGYSDVTALHAALHRHAGLATLHGLMATPDLADATKSAWNTKAFLRLATDPAPARLDNPPGFPRRCIRPGRAEGRLIGGNLSLVAASLGTPWAEDFDGALLFLEDVNERSYVIDRLLTQLANAGVFDRVGGVLLGEFTNCDPKPPSHDFTCEALFRERFAAGGVPVLAGIRCGHVHPKLSLPLGTVCRMDAQSGLLEMAEGLVCAAGVTG